MSKFAVRGLWKNLLEPINPNLSILIGLLNVVYGGWLLFIPNDAQAIYQSLSTVMAVNAWGLYLLILGIVMMVVNRMYKPSAHVKPMFLNAITWLVMSGVVAYNEWMNNAWVLMLFVAIYSIFVAANFWANWVYKPKV